MRRGIVIASLAAVLLVAFTAVAREPLASRITPPGRRIGIPSKPYNGAGEIVYQVLLDTTSPALFFDRALLSPVTAMAGGKGAAQYRRVIGPSVFAGPWTYTDHLVLPPGTTAGQQIYRGVAEVYYVMAGSGRITVGSETAAIEQGDALQVQLNEVHAPENNGSVPLELLIFGISRERNKEVQ